MAEPDRAAQGERGEALAAEFLRRNGLTILRRNCRSRWGEIDLLAREGDAVVFVEVKTRASERWGLPEDAVTPAKRFKLGLTARALCDHFRLWDRPLRFDVVAVRVGPDGASEVRHFRDAFPLRLKPSGRRPA